MCKYEMPHASNFYITQKLSEIPKLQLKPKPTQKSLIVAQIPENLENQERMGEILCMSGSRAGMGS